MKGNFKMGGKMRKTIGVFSVFLVMTICYLPIAMAGAFSTTVSPISYDFGSGGAGDYETPMDHFTLQNVGTSLSKVTIKTTSPDIWTVGGVPGPNRYALQWGTGTEPNWAAGQISASPTSLISELPPEERKPKETKSKGKK